MAMSPEQRKANRRLGLILATVTGAGQGDRVGT